MSDHARQHPNDSTTVRDTIVDAAELPWYRRERWLAVQVAALVPILGAMLAPATYRVPLCVLGGALVAISLMMLLRHKPTPARVGYEAGSGSR